MLYCIVNLVTKHNEEPLECLCNLLKTVGKELEEVNLLFILLCRLKIIFHYIKYLYFYKFKIR